MAGDPRERSSPWLRRRQCLDSYTINRHFYHQSIWSQPHLSIDGGGKALRRRNLYFSLGCFFSKCTNDFAMLEMLITFSSVGLLFFRGRGRVVNFGLPGPFRDCSKRVDIFSHRGERGIWGFFRIFVPDLAVRPRIAHTHPQRKTAWFWHTRPFGSRDVGTNDKRCSFFFQLRCSLTRNINKGTQLVFFHILILYIIYSTTLFAQIAYFHGQLIWLFEPLFWTTNLYLFIFRIDVRHFFFSYPILICCCCCCMKKQSIRATQHSLLISVE